MPVGDLPVRTDATFENPAYVSEETERLLDLERALGNQGLELGALTQRVEGLEELASAK